MSGPSSRGAVPAPLPREIPALTSLRFFASLWVLVLHSRMLIPFPVHEYTGLVIRGNLAVDFFFLLSGFILSHAYFSQVEAGSFHPLRFYQKRLARIYPLHFVVLMAYAAFVLAYPDIERWSMNSEH
jgi:peptidoglycan/LPS O-acetylase OafA/YrhL